MTAYLFSQELPVPADLGRPAEAAGIQVGQDAEAEEAGQDPGEVHMAQRHVVVEPALDETILGSATLPQQLV